MDKKEISNWFMQLQDEICSGLEELDGMGTFRQDEWHRDGGGGGRTRVIEGAIIEKGGVNYSAVHGSMPAQIAKALGLEENNFFATGVSIVLHPVNPHVPIIHMNVRYFETDTGRHWFGGGIDVTPHYIVEPDAIMFHKEMKEICDKLSETAYADFKKWADDYFFLKHRNETRGIGGIFFDRLEGKDESGKNKYFSFVKDVGKQFLPSYFQLVLSNNHKPYGDKEKHWQYVRRGRYVEFNLVWDKGTKFGLDTNGRTESILMSLPPQARWVYDHQVEEGSEEFKTQELLRKGVNWVNYTIA